MAIEIVTKEDLQLLRVQIIGDMRSMILQLNQVSDVSRGGYKTSHVRKLLGCSVNKLASLRIYHKLRTKKIGGTIYYNTDDVRRLLEEGFR